MEILTQFAEASGATKGGILDVLGINWSILALQLAAFLVLVFVLGKFVYPWLLKSIDERQENIEASAKALAKAQAATADIDKRTAEALHEARNEAKSIIESAKVEAESVIKAAEAKSKERGDRIISDAEVQIDKDVIAAKKDLYNEMIDLVALAVEKVVGKTLSSSADNTVIAEAIKEADNQVPDSNASRRKVAQYYAKAITDGKDDEKIVAQLADFLVSNGRTKEMDMIVADIEYQLSLDGVVTANVTSAHHLDEMTKKAVVELVTKQTGAKDVQLNEQINSNVVGGVKLEVSGSELDTTVARRLKALKTNSRKTK